MSGYFNKSLVQDKEKYKLKVNALGFSIVNDPFLLFEGKKNLDCQKGMSERMGGRCDKMANAGISCNYGLSRQDSGTIYYGYNAGLSFT
jgi:hypothetical protein